MISRETEKEEPVSVQEDEVMLFTTKTCPNCVQAKRLLEEAGIRYEQVLAEDHPDMVRELGIRQAPTLVLNNDRNQKKIGVGAIRNYILEKQ